jgi:amino acid transporter
VSGGVFIAVFLVCVVLINYLDVKTYGEVQFWLSSIKVIFLVGLTLVSVIIACGGGPNHHATGFQYWNKPGAFHEFIATGSTGRFLALYSAITTSMFTYIGAEMVGFTVGEAVNPRKAIPRAIKLAFFQIFAFYVILVFLVGMTVPFNASPLLKGASPFMVAIQISGIKGLPSVFMAGAIICFFSAANADLYVATRTLYGLSYEGKASKIFSRTDKRGVPIFALALSALSCLSGFFSLLSKLTTMFACVANIVTLFGVLSWISILITHICFVRARRAQNIPDTSLVYTAPLGIWGSIGALCFAIILIFFNGFALFCYRATARPGTTPKFDTKTFTTTYLAIPIYFVLFFGYKFIMKVQSVKPETADLFGGKEKIDTEEEEYLAREKARKEAMLETKLEKLFRVTTGRTF